MLLLVVNHLDQRGFHLLSLSTFDGEELLNLFVEHVNFLLSEKRHLLLEKFVFFDFFHQGSDLVLNEIELAAEDVLSFSHPVIDMVYLLVKFDDGMLFSCLLGVHVLLLEVELVIYTLQNRRMNIVLRDLG